jgi:hypothetical protein
MGLARTGGPPILPAVAFVAEEFRRSRRRTGGGSKSHPSIYLLAHPQQVYISRYSKPTSAT